MKFGWSSFNLNQVFKTRPPLFFKNSNQVFKEIIKTGELIHKKNFRVHSLSIDNFSQTIPFYKKNFAKENNEIILKKKLPLINNSILLFLSKISIKNSMSLIYFKKKMSKNFSRHFKLLSFCTNFIKRIN